MRPRGEIHVRRVLCALERLWVIAVTEERFAHRLEAALTLLGLFAGFGFTAAGCLYLAAAAVKLLELPLLLGAVVALVVAFLDWLERLLPRR